MGSAIFVLSLHFARLDVAFSEILQLVVTLATLFVIIFGLPRFLAQCWLLMVNAAFPMSSGGLFLRLPYDLSLNLELIFDVAYAEATTNVFFADFIESRYSALPSSRLHFSHLDTGVVVLHRRPSFIHYSN